MSDTQQRIDELVKGNDVVLFMKGSASFPQCGFSGRAVQVLKACGLDTSGIKTVNVLEDEEIRSGIKEYSNWPTIPQLYVKGEFIGGSDIMMEMYESGELQKALAREKCKRKKSLKENTKDKEINLKFTTKTTNHKQQKQHLKQTKNITKMSDRKSTRLNSSH